MEPTRQNASERIALVRLSHLGDVVAALPVYHALRAAHPGAAMAWVVQPEFADLVRPLPGLERVIPFERRGGARAWPRVWRALRSFSPDLVVDAQGNSKSAAVLLGSGVRWRAGLHRRDWREPFGAWLVNDPASPSGAVHAGERMRHLARHLLPEVEDGALRADPALTAAEEARGAERLGELAPYGTDGVVLLHLSPPRDVRAWPAERFAELASALVREGRPVAVLSGPAERDAGAALRDALAARPEAPRVGHWVGQRGLRELAALFAAAASAGGTLVACDSGPMHLAAACGLPVVTLDGPQSAERTGPWPQGERSRHRSVRYAGELDCAPCLARRCARDEGPVCMHGIAPRDVLAALAG